MIGRFKDLIMGAISKRYVDKVVDETAARVNLKVEEITQKSILTIKEIVPPIVYSSLFFASGAIVLILGISAYIDSLLSTEGAGLMIGGSVLLVLGLYYKNKLEGSLKKIKSRNQ
ncbi:MAG: hypothetical protein ABIG39_05360 [Candidatus Micrarchaeota archaeon]